MFSRAFKLAFDKRSSSAEKTNTSFTIGNSIQFAATDSLKDKGKKSIDKVF
jgi:hypothetical protein